MKTLDKKIEISKLDEKQLNEIKGGMDSMSVISKQDASKEGDGKALVCCVGQTEQDER